MGVIKQYIAALGAALCAFSLGVSIGWSGPMESPITKGEAYSFKPPDDEWGWTSSMMTFGAGCICIPVGILIAKFGRKTVMLSLVLPHVIGWLFLLLAQHVAMLMIGRFIVGACGGASCVALPIYTTEIAQLDLRGVMGCFFQLILVFGILYSFTIGGFLKSFMVNLLCAICPIIFYIIFIWMPESPVYLIQKGKAEKASKAMKWLRGDKTDISGEMSAMAADASKKTATVSEALGRRTARKGLFIGIMLMVFQQFTGINAIIFYSTRIFEQANIGKTAYLCTIILGVIQVVSTIMAMLIVENGGRVFLLTISSILMCATTAIMAAYFAFWMESNVSWLPVIAISIFVVGYSLGFGPVPWLILAELFADDVKPLCVSIVGTSSWLLAFCVTKLFPISLKYCGPELTFLIFAVFSFLAGIFVFLFVPETKGRTLNEIQALLGS